MKLRWLLNEWLLYALVVTVFALPMLPTHPAKASTTCVISSDRQETSTALVEAQLSSSKDTDSEFLTDFQVKITRNNSTAIDAALPVALLPSYDSSYGITGIDADTKVIDLDACN